MKLLKITLALIMTFALCSCSVANVNEPTTQPNTDAQTSAPSTHTPTPNGPFAPIKETKQETTLENGETKLLVSISLPNIEDANADDVNTRYKDTMTYYLTEYAPMFAEEISSEHEATGGTTAELYVDYSVKHNDGDVISLVVREGITQGDTYTEGYMPLNYSLKQKKYLTLGDVIKGGDSPLEKAAKSIAAQIAQEIKNGNKWGFRENLDENTIAMYISDESFYIASDGSVVMVIHPAYISDSQSGLCEFKVQ